ALRVADNILDLIGRTPLVRLRKVAREVGPEVFAKLEFFNPGGSIKDRIGLAMILDAERKGLIKPGYTIVEPTSGNTGTGLAMVAVLRGYKIVFTVPDKMSKDKIDLLRAFGATVKVTPSRIPPDHPESYVEVAKRIARDTPHSYMPNQYQNPANPQAHYRTTGPEIWEQTDGTVTVLVAGVGTGGTITGAGRYLKERNRRIRVVGADPEGSILAGKFKGSDTSAMPYKVEGIGEDFVPGTLDFSVVDEFVTVSDKDAFLMARRLAREEGILAGGSSGEAVWAALQVAKGLGKSDKVVVILPDTGRSYINKLYDDDWMAEHGYIQSKGKRLSVDAILRSKPASLRGVIAVSPLDSLSKTIALMKRHEISQLPVTRNGVQVGSLSAASMFKVVAKGKLVRTMKVEDVMEAPLPTVERSGSMLNPSGLLRDKGAVAVAEGSKVVGIITTIDVVNYLAK
ncbi:MAG TPA: cystathionine beta-synthase, partial [Nitrososphaerales archaeon]|nr:cystathionine beta-synthase [Nitrososphaerales archaeon]